MAWSNDAQDAKMLMDIPATMNNVQLALNSVDICLDNMLQVLSKSLPCWFHGSSFKGFSIVFPAP